MTCTIKRSLPDEMWSGNYSYLMFPMLPNDTLLALLMRANHNNGFRPRRKLSITLQKYLCRQLVEALIYLHQVDKMAHGDVKPDNTMITHDYRLVLIDFGHSEKVKKLIKHRIGTPAYRGPEVPDETCDENEYYAVERAELYALGCTLFTIMFQNIPFKNEGEKDKRFTAQAFQDTFKMDLADTYQKFYQEHYAYFNQTEQVHSHDELGLVFSLLNPNPILRPRLTEVYDHPWIQSASVVATQEIIQEMQELIKLPTPPERK